LSGDELTVPCHRLRRWSESELWLQEHSRRWIVAGRDPERWGACGAQNCKGAVGAVADYEERRAESPRRLGKLGEAGERRLCRNYSSAHHSG